MAASHGALGRCIDERAIGISMNGARRYRSWALAEGIGQQIARRQELGCRRNGLASNGACRAVFVAHERDKMGRKRHRKRRRSAFDSGDFVGGEGDERGECLGRGDAMIELPKRRLPCRFVDMLPIGGATFVGRRDGIDDVRGASEGLAFFIGEVHLV